MQVVIQGTADEDISTPAQALAALLQTHGVAVKIETNETAPCSLYQRLRTMASRQLPDEKLIIRTKRIKHLV